MLEFETESTVMKLVRVAFIIYLCMFHLAVGGDDDDGQTAQKSMFCNKDKQF